MCFVGPPVQIADMEVCRKNVLPKFLRTYNTLQLCARGRVKTVHCSNENRRESEDRETDVERANGNDHGCGINASVLPRRKNIPITPLVVSLYIVLFIKYHTLYCFTPCTKWYRRLVVVVAKTGSTTVVTGGIPQAYYYRISLLWNTLRQKRSESCHQHFYLLLSVGE